MQVTFYVWRDDLGDGEWHLSFDRPGYFDDEDCIDTALDEFCGFATCVVTEVNDDSSVANMLKRLPTASAEFRETVANLLLIGFEFGLNEGATNPAHWSMEDIEVSLNLSKKSSEAHLN